MPSESIAAETPGWLGLGWSELMMIWVVAITAGIGAVGQRLVAARPNAPAPCVSTCAPTRHALQLTPWYPPRCYHCPMLIAAVARVLSPSLPLSSLLHLDISRPRFPSSC